MIRKNGKLILSLLLIVAMTFVCTACTTTNKLEGAKIICAGFPEYDFARAILGDDADIALLKRPGTEAHSYEPTPREIQSLSKCDLFIYNGGETDEWIEDIIDSTGLTEEQTFVMMDCVEKLNSEVEEDEYDEHIWTSPKNAAMIVDKMAAWLEKRYPESAERYAKNAEAYIEKIDAIDAGFNKLSQTAKTKTIIFGDRFPFLYLCKAYGFEYMAAYAGCGHETEPSAKRISEIIEAAKTESHKAVFYLELSNRKMCDAICEETGAKAMLLHSAQTVSAEDFEKGITYVDIMEGNLKNLEEALK